VDGCALSAQAAGRPPSALQPGHQSADAEDAAAEDAAADCGSTRGRRGQLTRSPDQTAFCLCPTRAGWALAQALIARERRGGIENGAANDGAVRRETSESPARDVPSCWRRHSTFRSRLPQAVACSPFTSSLALSPGTNIYCADSGRETHFPLHSKHAPCPNFLFHPNTTTSCMFSVFCISHYDYACTAMTAVQLCGVCKSYKQTLLTLGRYGDYIRCGVVVRDLLPDRVHRSRAVSSWQLHCLIPHALEPSSSAYPEGAALLDADRRSPSGRIQARTAPGD
jgi:hypothetical protein